ncbi:MAG: NAD-dependent epimerase/dehydratase family protein [Deltaproteobacteria bacterium]|nr:NAD-dependent epimerase/dehydratase family protein [Deltaproteobacteria bacterium]
MNSGPPSPLHVVIGAGQIGPQVAARLAAAGLRVRMLRRSALSDVPPGVEAVRADILDPRQADDALRGASVVYHCANPPYHRWGTELLPLTRAVVEGATRAGARLVALDNLYMYGRTPGGVMREDTPVAPCSRKGALRAEAAALMLDAHRRGDVEVVMGRAADFMGPHVTISALGDRFWVRLLAGKPVEVMGDPDQPHSFSYAPDVARGLVTLGAEAEGADLGRAWHLPALTAEPTRAWIQRFAEAGGQRPRLTTLTPFTMKLAGLFIPAVRELPEMLYQWEAPFILDDAAFRNRFGVAPTPAAEVVAQTLAWATAHYGAPARAA